MKIRKSLLVILAGVAVFAVSGTAKAQLFYDDFSSYAYTGDPGYSGSLPGHGTNPSAPGSWQVSGNMPGDTFIQVGINNSATGYAFEPTNRGGVNSYAFLQGAEQRDINPVLSRIISAAFASGETYTLSFVDAVRAGDQGAGFPTLVISIYDGTDSSGTLIGSFTRNPLDTVFTLESMNFSGITGSDIYLSFSTFSDPLDDDYTLDLSNVSIAAVPEPSTYALALLALVVFGLEVRRRKAQSTLS